MNKTINENLAKDFFETLMENDIIAQSEITGFVPKDKTPTLLPFRSGKGSLSFFNKVYAVQFTGETYVIPYEKKYCIDYLKVLYDIANAIQEVATDFYKEHAKEVESLLSLKSNNIKVEEDLSSEEEELD